MSLLMFQHLPFHRYEVGESAPEYPGIVQDHYQQI